MECKPLGGPASPGPTSTPTHAGSRARGPECLRAKSPERKLAPNSKAPHQERIADERERKKKEREREKERERKRERERERERASEHRCRAFQSFTLKDPPEIPCMGDASGSVQLLLQ